MKASCLLPALALLLPLSSCKPTVESLQGEWLTAHMDNNTGEDWEAEAAFAVAHYLRTGDARYATAEHAITMLHIAAATLRLWLVEKLLAEGANPNACMLWGEERQPGATPLLLAVRAGGSTSNVDALLIVKALIKGGADINLTGGGSVLGACDNDCRRGRASLSGEEMMLELLRLGARGDTDSALLAISNGWPSALEALLTFADGENIGHEIPNLLNHSATLFGGELGELACARVLMEHARSVNERDHCGNTPLFLLAKRISSRPDESHTCADTQYILALLNKGADPRLPDGEFRETCAADYLTTMATVAEELQKNGYKLSAPVHHFSEERLIEQVLDIPAEAIRTEEAATHFELLASLFSAPSEAMFRHKLLYRQACAKALSLLHRADAARTRALLLAHPAWRDLNAWQGEADAARALLIALRENPQVILPQQHLLDCARHMEQAGKPGLAHAFIRLLARDEEAAGLIDELCAEDTPIPLRAAAWSCRLEQAKLPTLGHIETWRYESIRHGHYCSYAVLERACRAEKSVRCISKLAPLTMPERLYYEPDGSEDSCALPDAEERAGTQATLRELGAPLSALYCGDMEPAELAPEWVELMKRYGTPTAASLELELVLSRYLWENHESYAPETNTPEPPGGHK